MGFEFMKIVKYNIKHNQWQERKIILNQINVYSNNNKINKHHLPFIHDLAYDINKKILYMIDSDAKVWFIDANDDYKVLKNIKLNTDYSFRSRNYPKLTIVDNNLYVLTPDYNCGRYVIDISNEKQHKIKRLGIYTYFFGLYRKQIYIYT